MRTLKALKGTSYLLGFSIVLAPFIGAEWFPLGSYFEPGSVAQRILFELRLPRVLLALAAGALLSVLGGTYQILFRNPLAEPFVLGVSSAVTLVLITCDVVFHLPIQGLFAQSLGILAALVAITGVLYFGRNSNAGSTERVILFGMGLNFVLSSMVFLLLSYAQQQVGGGSLRWLFGSIPWVTLTRAVFFLGVAGVTILGVVLFAPKIEMLGLGDSVATTLGISPGKVRLGFIIFTSIALALLVSTTGAIGFVGLVVPNAVRVLWRQGSGRWFFIWSAVLGGVFLIWSDVLSRAVFPPLEFPIGIFTTLIGGPLFLILLSRRRA